MNLPSRFKSPVFSNIYCVFPYRFNPSPSQIPTGSCAFWPLEKAIVPCLNPPITIDPPTTHTHLCVSGLSSFTPTHTVMAKELENGIVNDCLYLLLIALSRFVMLRQGNFGM